MALWDALFGAKGPAQPRQPKAEGPDLTPTEAALLERMHAQMETLALPSVPLATGPRIDAPLGSAFGGGAWRPDGAPWPQAADGRPMLFLAQINFADLPPLPEFPTAGLLQIFVEADGTFWGCDLDDPTQNHRFVIEWHPEPSGGALAYNLYPRRETPFQIRADSEMPKRDASLFAHAVVPDCPVGNWQLDDLLEPLDDELAELVTELLLDAAPRAEDHHAVGGHPRFTQWDIRFDEDLRAYDRVLLRIGTDDRIMFGDAGQANFMIKHTDLAERAFSRAIFYWGGA